MTAMQVNDLAYEYAENKADQPLGAELYQDAVTWFKARAGVEALQEDYSVFIDLAWMWTKNRNSMLLSDAYRNAPEW